MYVRVKNLKVSAVKKKCYATTLFDAFGYGGFRVSSCGWDGGTHTATLVVAFSNCEKRLNTKCAVDKFRFLFLESFILSEGLLYIVLWKYQMLKGRSHK